MSWLLSSASEVPLWRPAPSDPAFVLAFTTRQGGVSDPPFATLNLGRSTADSAGSVERNRLRVLLALDLVPTGLATAGQVHGSRVAVIAAPGHTPECDALLTTTPGLALAVTTADCMSLLFAAPGAVAAAHSGWRGTQSGLPAATLNAVREAAGCVARDVIVHFGPCIRGCCYEVGDDVASQFPPEAVSIREGRTYLDLPTAAAGQLLALGIERIEDTGACTACEPAWYFSHRRDHGACGRHWAVAALPGAARDGIV